MYYYLKILNMIKSLALTAILFYPEIEANSHLNNKEEQKILELSDDGYMVVSGTRDEHTRHEDGSFKHPFLYAPQGVEYIEYPDEGAFSVKLTPQPKKTQRKRPGNERTYSDLSLWEKVERFFEGEQSRYLNVPWTNHGDLEYVGPVYLGSQRMQ